MRYGRCDSWPRDGNAGGGGGGDVGRDETILTGGLALLVIVPIVDKQSRIILTSLTSKLMNC